MIVRMRDVRACLMCSRGAREFFRNNDLDWQDFLQNGIDTETLKGTGDAMALRVVEHVERK
ncbi:MAG: hypothetical protein AAF662_08300 [Pseudomonadota bacterium]